MKTRMLSLIAVLALATSASAAEIKVLCTNGVKAVVEELLPRFEQSSGDKVTIVYEPSTQLKKRVDAGEAFDLVIMTTPIIEEEISAGRLAEDSRPFIAQSGLWMSIGASAAHYEVLVAKLGITSALKPKYNLRPTAAEVGEAVSSGVVEIGIAPVS